MRVSRLHAVFGQVASYRLLHERRPANPRLALAMPLFVVMLLLPDISNAQKEMWLDYYATFPAGRFWSYEINPGMSKGLTDPVWLDTYLCGNATYQDQNWLSTEGNFEAHYTFNATTENVVELRPWLGLNLIWATFGEVLNLFYPSFSFRFEDRFLWYQTSGTQATKQRMRMRLFARFPINNPTLVKGTYYLITLVEGYFPLNGEAKEISADKRRFQIGLGYVVAADLRIEMQYLLMRQRNTLQNKFETSSNIVWLALRNFL